MKLFLILVFLSLLTGCNKTNQFSKEEIENLCNDIGEKAYWDDKVSSGPPAFAAKNGAIAECKLKYLKAN
jgi:major membrane immunogen (membrane-anchored lipoprotein)